MLQHRVFPLHRYCAVLYLYWVFNSVSIGCSFMVFWLHHATNNLLAFQPVNQCPLYAWAQCLTQGSHAASEVWVKFVNAQRWLYLLTTVSWIIMTLSGCVRSSEFVILLQHLILHLFHTRKTGTSTCACGVKTKRRNHPRQKLQNKGKWPHGFSSQFFGAD